MGSLLERFLYGLLVLLACLRRLEAAHFAFDGEGSGYGVARAAATDPAYIDAGLIVGKRTVWVVGRAKDVDSVDCLRQVLARMAGAAARSVNGMYGYTVGVDPKSNAPCSGSGA